MDNVVRKERERDGSILKNSTHCKIIAAGINVKKSDGTVKFGQLCLQVSKENEGEN